MSPSIKGGGATAPNSVAATKEETPTGPKETGNRFNNDTGADDKWLSVSTTPRTDLSIPSPIELDRYYCRRNWYIDMNGYYQFHMTYDKIVINNKSKNKNVTTPKQLERVPDNTNEEQGCSELNNMDVNNEFEVIITPETTPHREGVLKVRDSSKSNTTSVATKKKTPTTGPKRRRGGFKNNSGNRKSTTSIVTKSNLSALRNNDMAPHKEGVSPTGQREIGKRFNNGASTGNENSLSVTVPRTNLLPYIETPRQEGVPKEHDSSEPYKDNNTPPCKEGVSKEHNSSEPYKNNNMPPCKEGVPIN